MARLLRSDLPDGTFHVTARGVDRAPVFLDDDDRRDFLRLLAETVARHDWCCHAFCLMGNHYHLLVDATRPRLSAGVHRLNGVYAQGFNRRHARTGHLFGGRFSSWIVETEAHLERTYEYVLQNPVRAGFCDHADDWPWSGTRAG